MPHRRPKQNVSNIWRREVETRARNIVMPNVPANMVLSYPANPWDAQQHSINPVVVNVRTPVKDLVLQIEQRESEQELVRNPADEPPSDNKVS